MDQDRLRNRVAQLQELSRCGVPWALADAIDLGVGDIIKMSGRPFRIIRIAIGDDERILRVGPVDDHGMLGDESEWFDYVVSTREALWRHRRG